MVSLLKKRTAKKIWMSKFPCFPRSLRKTIRRDRRGRWIRGYQFHPTTARARKQLRKLPLERKRHLCLPLPEVQGQGDYCLQHSVINCMEARLRIRRWKQDPRRETQRLSIQHAIDATAPMGEPDAVYDLLGIPYAFRSGSPFAAVGVTTAETWPYRGPDADPMDLNPSEVSGWKRFKLVDLDIYQNDYYYTDPNFEAVINNLIRELRNNGPFIASFRVLESHTDARKIFKRKGRRTGFIHSVVVTGWMKWRKSNGNLDGYWEYLDSYGLNNGRKGFGRIAFDAVKSVEVPYA